MYTEREGARTLTAPADAAFRLEVVSLSSVASSSERTRICSLNIYSRHRRLSRSTLGFGGAATTTFHRPARGGGEKRERERVREREIRFPRENVSDFRRSRGGVREREKERERERERERECGRIEKPGVSSFKAPPTRATTTS